MQIFRGISLLATVAATTVTLAGCSGFKSHSEVEALNEVKSVGSPFTQELVVQYRDYANQQQNIGFDYADALHFARKGLAAASGEVVLPEPVSDWNLKPEHVEELTSARAMLVGALDGGAREAAPQKAALAQAKFDCWIEQQEENWNDASKVTCKNEFADAMNAIGGMVAAPAPDEFMPPVTAAPAPAGQMAPEDAKYLVFFDFNSSKVDAGGSSVIDSVAAEIQKQNISGVNVIGYTDTSGSAKYNKRLSAKRANAVRDALVARGINANLLMIDSMGEENLMVQTGDNVREPANRRAEITFVK